MEYTAHITFHPKHYREGARERFEELIREIAKERGWELMEIAFQPDCVHLLIKFTVAGILNNKSC